MNINLEYYKIFYYVAQFGSISRAADELCISQPAVSQAVKLLEQQISSCLFLRSAKGVKLTKEGEILYSYIKQGYEYIMLGEQKMKELQNLESGEIIIGASDMTLQYFLLPYLELYHKKYPKIKVNVTNAPTPETLHNLENGRIDFGLVSEPFEAGNHISVKSVKDIKDVFVAGNAFFELKHKKLNFFYLEKIPIICLENNTSTRTYIDRFLRTRDVVLKPEFELATSDIIVQFSLRSMGIGCVVEDFAAEYIKNGELFALEFEEDIPARKICIAVNQKVPLSSSARILLEMIENGNI